MTIESNGSESNERDQVGSLDVGHPMGVRVIVDGNPVNAADQLATTMGGEVIADAGTARTAFAARADAARTTPVVLEDDEVDELVSQASEADAVDERMPVSEAAVLELRELADAIGRTDRIRYRTEVEFTETLNRRLSASSGVAVHPETIKQAASAVTVAEGEFNEITAAITQLGDRPRPEEVELETPAEVEPRFTDHHLETQRRWRAFAFALSIAFVGAGLILSQVFDSVVILIAMTVVGGGLAMWLLVRNREHHDDRDEREASALLAAATGNAERTTEAAARGRMAEEDWLSRRSQLEAAGERAEEKARSARRHWETLAGADADPYDLESVLQLHDPQFLITGAATQTSPTVRTVNAVHRKALARWKVAWAALGYDTPPSIDEMDEHLSRVTKTEARDEAERAGRRLKDAEAWAAAGVTIDRPMILVEPYEWVEEEELSSMLATLPAGAEVILVVSH